MLSFVLFMMLVCQGTSLVSYGKDFITAFPENIAYYYTQDSWATLKITAFYNGTAVQVTINSTAVYNKILNSGQTQNIHFPLHADKYRASYLLHCVRIVGDRPIVVLWTTQRGDSIQSNVVQPTENLGKKYFIPTLNYTEMIGLYSVPKQLAQTSRTYNTFKLIIINALDYKNTISIRTAGVNDINITLNSYELYEVSTNDSNIMVSSSDKVAVLLTHPCVEIPGCGCNMVVNQVLPNSLWGENFVIPSLSNTNATWLHVASETKIMFNGMNVHSRPTQLVSFPYLKDESQFIDTDKQLPLRVVSPGFIFEIIPETMFAACYLVQFNSPEGEIVVIAEKDQKDDVHIDNGLLSSTDWKHNTNSKYSSVSLSLTGTHVIWHPASKISVYMFEKMNSGILYGGSAIPLNDVPDQDGCVAEPASFIAGTHLMTWTESHQYCLNATYQLATPNSPSAESKMVDWLQKIARHGDVWIGLRRSLLTLDWYWQAGDESIHNVSYTVWAAGQPDEPWKAMCASGHLDPKGKFSWKSVLCCDKMRPVCYKTANTFSEMTFETLGDIHL